LAGVIESPDGEDTSWRGALTDAFHAREATRETPPEQTPETPETPSPSVPAPEPESPSVPEAEPEAPAVESPSPVQPEPASPDVPPTAVATLAKRGLKIDDEKTAAEYLRVESELAKRVRAEKETARAQPAPAQAPAEAEPDRPTPRPIEPPPEPPAPVPQVEEVVAQYVGRDSVCVALASEYYAIEGQNGQPGELDRVGRLDPYGNPVGGVLRDMVEEIAALSRIVSPPTAVAKKHGFEIPELDPLQRQEIEAKLLRLRLDYHQGVEYAKRLSVRSDSIRQEHEQRVDYYRSRVGEQYQARAEAEQRDAGIETLAAQFRRTWESTTAAALKLHTVPVELHDEIKETLRQAGLAHPGAIDLDELPDFMAKVIKTEVAKADKYHRLKSAQYAQKKDALTQAAIPGPNGKAAIAPPSPQQSTDWREAITASFQAARASRRK
jgi:hypothetical protein